MYPTIATISGANLRHNLHQIQKRSGSNSIWAVLKANGYGHGAIPLAQTLQDEVEGICVATIPEAISLRQAGIQTRILVMGLPLPQWLKHYDTWQLELNVGSLEIANLVAEGAKCGLKFKVHVKLDTGMHRLGILPNDFTMVNNILSHPLIAKKGLWTHFAVADEQNEFNQIQIQRFFDTVNPYLSEFEAVHLGNSGGSLYLAQEIPHQPLHFRAGLALYGISPMQQSDDLKPVMTFQSVVVQTKEIAKGETVSYGRRWQAAHNTRIAIINCGYADGYPREVLVGTTVQINQQRYPIVGRVCMDMMMVEIGDALVEVGDRVELWGGELPIWEVANAANTIPYTLLTRVSQRVQRIYLQ